MIIFTARKTSQIHGRADEKIEAAARRPQPEPGKVAMMARSTRKKPANFEWGMAPSPLRTLCDAGENSPFDKDDDDFLVHLGLLQPGEVKTSWYPIGEEELERIWCHLSKGDDDGWFVITTLNNRILAFRPTCMKRIWLLDDACDAPEGDWDGRFLWGDCDGLAKEVYRAIGAWAWEQLDGPPDFSQDCSETLQQMALARIEEAGLSDKPDQVFAAIYHTSVRLRTGELFSYEVEPDMLWEAIQAVEHEPSRMLSLPAAEGKFDNFFSSGEVVLLDMPLFVVEDEIRRERAELERAA